MRLLLLLFFILTMHGCITAPICTSEGAFEAGQKRALEGQTLNMEAGTECQDQERLVFQSNYEKGFASGRSTLCSVQFAGKEGRTLGLEGKPKPSLPNKYQLCPGSHRELEKAFHQEHKQGLEEYCAPGAAKSQGERDGSAGQAPKFSEGAYLVCGDRRAGELKLGYSAAYQQGLKGYCQVDRHMDMIRDLVMTNAQATFYQGRYEQCVEKFPELFQLYLERFALMRQELVKNQCTYSMGRKQAMDDAQKLQNPQQTLPSFCDEASSREYWQAYDLTWNEQKRAMCVGFSSEEHGYRDASEGRSPYPRFPALCPTSFYPEIKARYEQGYDRGVKQRRHRESRQEGNALELVETTKACAESFSFDSEKQQCLAAAHDIKGRADELIKACHKAFMMPRDKMQCITYSGHRNYNPAKTVSACEKAFLSSDDRFKCLNEVKATAFNPAQTVLACTDAFDLSQDKLKCLQYAAQKSRDPSDAIAACKKNSSFPSDVMKCVRI